MRSAFSQFAGLALLAISLLAGPPVSGQVLAPGTQPGAPEQAASGTLAATFRFLLQQAAFLYIDGDYEMASKNLDEAEKEHGIVPELLNLRGAIASRQRNFEKAREFFTAALERMPKSQALRMNLAEVEIQSGNYALGRKMFSAIRLEQKEADYAEFQVIISFLLEGNTEEADRRLEQMKFPPDTPAYYFAHAAREFNEGNKEKGLDWIREARQVYGLRIDFNYFDALAFYGWIDVRSAQGDLPEGLLKKSSPKEPEQGEPDAPAEATIKLGESAPAPTMQLAEPTPAPAQN